MGREAYKQVISDTLGFELGRGPHPTTTLLCSVSHMQVLGVHGDAKRPPMMPSISQMSG